MHKVNFKFFLNNKGFLQALPWLIPAATSLIGGFLGDKEEKEESVPQFKMAPEFEEAKGARGMWWDKLQDWGGQKGYGAISPDWDDIWQRTMGKVQRYWQGGPEGGGVAGRTKASLARRNVAQGPQAESLMRRKVDIPMGQQISDLATEQALQEAQFGERGRQSWMNQLMGLAGMQPGYVTYNQEFEPSMGENIAGLGGALGGYFQQQNFMNQLMSMLGGGQQQTQENITGLGQGFGLGKNITPNFMQSIYNWLK